MSLTLVLFLIGILGFVFNRKNIILMLISIEIMLLSITFLILISSINLDDIIGQTYAIYIIVVAGAESALGLAILVAFYRLRDSSITNYIALVNNTKANYDKNNIILLNQIRKYSTIRNSNSTLDPWFITGLFDAESSFVVTILKNSRYKTGWAVQPRIQIKMHEKDRDLIKSVQKFFGNIGYLSEPNNKSTVEFRVSTFKDLIDVIIPHFDNYPLLTKKYLDYILFKQIVSLMKEKEHSTLVGLQKIVNIKASINWGLSENLKEAFPNTILINKPNVNITYSSMSPEWIAGFATGESNFYIAIQKSETKNGLSTSVRFSIAQDKRDILLLKHFINIFGCGYINDYKNRDVCEFIVTRIDHIIEHIIPFFEQYRIVGSKYPNYINFKHAAFIIKNKEHLSEEGLNKILKLKNKIIK
uniref:NADH dehydrogenase subunit 4L n=2 Tax=Epichloe TaxID=5112 RepID=A0A1J0D0B7_EPINE|nr:NADH dehydrogenase subunit 4L [Epichloe festucae]APB96806.1 NADH dehydrogenase subunit 4L [Epichloe festucae]APB96866.1 NADH dehydrogenase subunit 4L [Epichloe hybrida]